jgi:hypothetical protein
MKEIRFIGCLAIIAMVFVFFFYTNPAHGERKFIKFNSG